MDFVGTGGDGSGAVDGGDGDRLGEEAAPMRKYRRLLDSDDEVDQADAVFAALNGR